MNRIITTVLVLSLSLAVFGQRQQESEVAKVLDQWHRAAAEADFERYFGHMTPEAVFIGTDATEYWKGESFRQFSKPYFDRGRAWNFSALERHIYVHESGDLAWFDELLDTQMELCRGSGVLKKLDGQWKIAHYVLSIAVPNENVTALTNLKKETDSLLKQKLRDKLH